MAISDGTVNSDRKRENMNKILNIETNGIYYSRQEKKQMNLLFIFGTELALNLSHVVVENI